MQQLIRIAPVLGIIFAGMAAAQTLDEHQIRCEGRPGLLLDRNFFIDTKLRIASCTAVIESDQETTQNLARAFHARGVAYIGLRDYERGIADYSEAISLDPNYWLAFHQRAAAYAAIGDYDRAIHDWSETIKLRPRSWDQFYHRGRAYAANGDNDRAIQDFSAAIALVSGGQRTWVFFHRGEARRAVGDYDRAIEDYDEAIRISPGYRCTWYRRGLAYRAKGDEERAKQDFDKANSLQNELVQKSKFRYVTPDQCSPPPGPP